MGKLVRKTATEPTNSSQVKEVRLKKILERKDRAAKSTADNPMLSSVPLSMQSTMNFIKENNDKAKESPNYGKISENKVGDENHLSDHDIFKNFFQR